MPPEYRRVQKVLFTGLTNAVNVTKYLAIDPGPRGIVSVYAQRTGGAGTAMFQAFKTFKNGNKSGVTVSLSNDVVSLGSAVAGGSGVLTAIHSDISDDMPYLAIQAVPTNASDYEITVVSR